jgi:hypothetical protein
MLPSIRLVIAAIIASVVLMIGGFGLVATFQIAKTSIDAPPRGAASPNPAPADRLGRKRSTIMSKVEELRMAFEADDYSTLARIVGSLVWERDVEARYQLAEWIESGELMLMEEKGAKKLRRRGYATLAA